MKKQSPRKEMKLSSNKLAEKSVLKHISGGFNSVSCIRMIAGMLDFGVLKKQVLLMFIEIHIVPGSVLSSPLIFNTTLPGKYNCYPCLTMKGVRLREVKQLYRGQVVERHEARN